MKQKKWIALLLVLVMTASVLAGCGGSSASKDMATMEAAPMEAPLKNSANGVMMSGSAATADTIRQESGQKLIRRVSINAETEDLEALLPELLEQVAKTGGYIENQELYNGSAYSTYRHRSASLIIRIPADKLDSFINQVQDVSNVVSYNESQEDVTLTYVSTESRIKALETEQARLLELLAKAENMSDLLEIEARLTDVRYELERVTSQLRVLANQVDYATVNLYIDQVKVYTEVEEQTVWQRIGSGFKKNLKNIGENAVDFFVWVVTYSPQLLFWAAVAAAALVLLRRRNQKRRAKNTPKQDQE